MLRQLATYLIFMCIGHTIWAQVELDRQLIGSGFSEFGSGNFFMSASLGEPIVATFESGALAFTQGFQQSNYVLSNPFILDLVATNAACIGANDGTVSVMFVSENLNPPLTYQWSNGQTTESINNAEVGIYSLTVTDALGNVVTNSARVSPTDSIDCAPKFYSGITPNGDNFNDYWHIDNAEFFSNKSVEIFNRYGTLVWNSGNYTNNAAAFMGIHANGQPLPDGTYFYIAKFDNSTYRGWIEISR